jgi:aryl carrier-like protein
VAEAAVVASASGQGKQLVAHVVIRASGSDNSRLTTELLQHCRSQLPAWMVPQNFIVHAALPQTATGKIDRRALAHEELEAPLAWPAEGSLQQKLRAVWAQLLGVADLDAQANLFESGARSLTVVRALTELRRHGFNSVTAAHLYEHPSVAAQAAWLETASAGVAEQAARMRGAQATGAVQRVALERFSQRHTHREG